MGKGKKNLTGSVGDDVLIADNEIIRLLGGYGDDIMTGSRANEHFFGGFGDDIVHSLGGNDTFAGGAGFDTFVTPDSVLDYSLTSDKQNPFASNKWSVTNNETGETSELKKVEKVVFDDYELFLDGRNNIPFSKDTRADATEDTELTGDLSGLVWDMEDSLSFLEKTVTTDNGATVTVHADGTYSYSPYENFSGTDSFTFSVTDGVNDPVTRTVTVDVKAVADTPELSVTISEGTLVNEVVVTVTSALTDTDGSESLKLKLDGIPANVAIASNGTIDSDGYLIIDNPQANEVITLTLPKESESHFDLSVTAISTEASNADSAEVTFTTPVDYTVSTTTQTYTYTADDQNMWGGGEAFQIGDHRFLGIEDTNGSDNLTYKLGLQSDFELDAGSVDAALTYDFTFNTYHNYATDLVLIDSDYTSLGGEFDTTTPYGYYNLDLIAGFDFSLDLPFGIGEIPVGTGGNQTVDLLYYDQNSFDQEVTIGPVTTTVSWPNVETQASSTSLTTMTASGEDDILALNIDLDEILTYFTGIPTDLSDSVDLTVLGIGFSGGYTLTALGLDLDGIMSLQQDFTLENNGIEGSLTLENGDLLTLDFDNDLLLHNASSYDVDDNGFLAFDADLGVDALFTNSTGLGFDIELGIRIAEASAWGTIHYAVDSETVSEGVGPLYSDTFEFDVGEINLYNDSFELAFADTEVLFIA